MVFCSAGRGCQRCAVPHAILRGALVLLLAAVAQAALPCPARDLIPSSCSSSPISTPANDSVPVCTGAAKTLQEAHDKAHLFAPYIFFHPLEKFFLTNVSQYLAQAKLYDADGEQISAGYVTEKELLEISMDKRVAKGTYLSANTTFGPHGSWAAGAPFNALNQSTAPVYYKLNPDPGNRTYIYHFLMFYAYNGCSNQHILSEQPGIAGDDDGRAFVQTELEFQACELGVHEGDWERVSVEVCQDLGTIIRVQYGIHAWEWELNCLRGECRFMDNTTNPVVYSSLAAHASYPTTSYNFFYEQLSVDRLASLKAFSLADRAVCGHKYFKPSITNVVPVDPFYPRWNWTQYNERYVQQHNTGNPPDWSTYGPSWVTYFGRWGYSFYDDLRPLAEPICLKNGQTTRNQCANNFLFEFARELLGITSRIGAVSIREKLVSVAKKVLGVYGPPFSAQRTWYDSWTPATPPLIFERPNATLTCADPSKLTDNLLIVPRIGERKTALTAGWVALTVAGSAALVLLMMAVMGSKGFWKTYVRKHNEDVQEIVDDLKVLQDQDPELFHQLLVQFDKLDVDNNGAITLDELKDSLRDTSFDTHEIEERIRNSSIEKQQRITFKEFIQNGFVAKEVRSRRVFANTVKDCCRSVPSGSIVAMILALMGGILLWNGLNSSIELLQAYVDERAWGVLDNLLQATMPVIIIVDIIGLVNALFVTGRAFEFFCLARSSRLYSCMTRQGWVLEGCVIIFLWLAAFVNLAALIYGAIFLGIHFAFIRSCRALDSVDVNVLAGVCVNLKDFGFNNIYCGNDVTAFCNNWRAVDGREVVIGALLINFGQLMFVSISGMHFHTFFVLKDTKDQRAAWKLLFSEGGSIQRDNRIMRDRLKCAEIRRHYMQKPYLHEDSHGRIHTIKGPEDIDVSISDVGEEETVPDKILADEDCHKQRVHVHLKGYGLRVNTPEDQLVDHTGVPQQMVCWIGRQLPTKTLFKRHGNLFVPGDDPAVDEQNIITHTTLEMSKHQSKWQEYVRAKQKADAEDDLKEDEKEDDALYQIRTRQKRAHTERMPKTPVKSSSSAPGRRQLVATQEPSSSAPPLPPYHQEDVDKAQFATFKVGDEEEVEMMKPKSVSSSSPNISSNGNKLTKKKKKKKKRRPNLEE